MTNKQKFGCLSGIISLFVTAPIWYYIQYQILVLVDAPELVWFLFWAYVPLVITLSVVKVIFDSFWGE